MWPKLTRLSHLEIPDLGYYDQEVPRTFELAPNRLSPFYDNNSFTLNLLSVEFNDEFLINPKILLQIPNLRTLKLGYDHTTASHKFEPNLEYLYDYDDDDNDNCEDTRGENSNDDDYFRLPPNLLKLIYYYEDRHGAEHEIEFQCTPEEKPQRKGRLRWLQDFRQLYSNYNFLPLLSSREFYEGEVDKYYQMHGKGLIYYHELNAIKVEKFEGTFKNGKEKEGTVYLQNGDRYEGKFHCFDGWVGEVVGKIFFANGDYYECKVREFEWMAEARCFEKMVANSKVYSTKIIYIELKMMIKIIFYFVYVIFT